MVTLGILIVYHIRKINISPGNIIILPGIIFSLHILSFRNFKEFLAITLLDASIRFFPKIRGSLLHNLEGLWSQRFQIVQVISHRKQELSDEILLSRQCTREVPYSISTSTTPVSTLFSKPISFPNT